MYQAITTSAYTFENIREKNLFYADKTDFFHRLVTDDSGIFFLSRPRRFGKSLSVSILKNIFKGNKELFKGLKIDDMPYDWKTYPVINLNISKAPCVRPFFIIESRPIIIIQLIGSLLLSVKSDHQIIFCPRLQ